MNKIYKKLFIVIFFFNFSLIYSQTKIKGLVKDSLGSPISFANVQIIKNSNNKIIAFKSTDELGAFEFNLNETLVDCELKISHILFSTKYISIKDYINNKLKYNEILLDYKENLLQEIKISNNFKTVNDKNDTIKYNFNKLLNGSEDKLKDVLNKLPGIKIDDNGKIRFNGKVIDDFLIDGDQLYNNQHQLATENIKSQMIAKIEVLKNYKSFSSFENESDTKKTALNVYIKDEYKNKINGIIDPEIGYKNRYRVHNYIFNFNKKIKASLILDVNNINSNIFKISDYFDLKQILNKEINNTNNSLIVEDNVPSFLLCNYNIV